MSEANEASDPGSLQDLATEIYSEQEKRWLNRAWDEFYLAQKMLKDWNTPCEIAGEVRERVSFSDCILWMSLFRVRANLADIAEEIAASR
jgi:hypothetical protein